MVKMDKKTETELIASLDECYIALNGFIVDDPAIKERVGFVSGKLKEI